MIYNHQHSAYRQRRMNAGNNKYNGAYYYSKDICKYIYPKVKTDRNWVTVNLPELKDTDVNLNHSIVFIHNNLQPNAYQWLRKYDDLILVCGIPSTMEKVRFFGQPVYLPLSVNIAQVSKYKTKFKSKIFGFAGRENKINNHVPKGTHIISGLSRSSFLKEIADYEYLYAVGRTAIEGKILGCKILPYDERFPDPSIWKVKDCNDSAELLQQILINIDGE